MNTLTLALALAVLRIATGLFFVTTGTRKLFMPDVRAKVHAMFDSHHVPFPMQMMVMTGEFLGGLGLLFGALTHYAAVGLLVIMLGAYKLDTWPAVKAKQGWHCRHWQHWRGRVFLLPTSYSQLLSNALCTPEAQLIVILITIALAGAGSFSLDSFIWR